MKLFVTIAFAMCATLVASAQNYYGSYGYGNQYNTRSSTLNGRNTSIYGGGVTNSSVRYQQGYTRTDGTYVQGHFRTNSNNTNHDNFSTQGNYNSYTGNTGYRARDYSSDAYNYGSGRTIYQGSRGGQYYINSNGKRTYVPKRGF